MQGPGAIIPNMKKNSINSKIKKSSRKNILAIFSIHKFKVLSSKMVGCPGSLHLHLPFITVIKPLQTVPNHRQNFLWCKSNGQLSLFTLPLKSSLTLVQKTRNFYVKTIARKNPVHYTSAKSDLLWLCHQKPLFYNDFP